MKSNLYVDVDYFSLNKEHEELCGDHVEIVKNDESTVVVLADGLGSGVKANILSILTSKILSTLLINDLSVETCVNTIASILPICSQRHVAYSTFTVFKINNNIVDIIEYDNPQVILLSSGKNKNINRTLTIIEEKNIYISKIVLEENDVLIGISDGVIHAGVGLSIDMGWLRDGVIKYIEKTYFETFTAKNVATILIDKCKELYENHPSDDTTVCVLKLRERKVVNLVIGPALNKSDDTMMMQLFFSKAGKKVVCGGTTAKIVSNFLGTDITEEDYKPNTNIPPISFINGVDLVTEGIITINKVLYYVKDYLDENSEYYNWFVGDDGASCITRLLIEEATDINFFVGKAINPAHQNPSLGIDFNIKMKLIEELRDCLNKIGKKIKISYF